MKALLVVDMVNDFVSSNGALTVPGAMALLPNIELAIKKIVEKEGKIIFCNDQHELNDPEFDAYPSHCIKGTWGSAILDSFMTDLHSTIVGKTTFSAFSNGVLDDLLKSMNVHTIFVCGVVTEICIKRTVWSARDIGYETFVLTDCIKGLDDADAGMALMKMGWWDALPIKSTEL